MVSPIASSIPIVCEFIELFPNDFPGMTTNCEF